MAFVPYLLLIHNFLGLQKYFAVKYDIRKYICLKLSLQSFFGYFNWPFNDIMSKMTEIVIWCMNN